MKILGLDNGYNFTKTSAGVRICSTITEGVDDINNVLQVTVGGKTYVVGEPNGKYISDADKMKSAENIEVLVITTLTSIAMSYPTERFIDVNLVVGVPVGYFTKQREEFKKMMEDLHEKIYVNKIGFEQVIRVNEVLVYPQSAGVVFKYSKKLKDESSLVIDIGGGTWDVSQFNGLKLEERATYKEGMLVLYEKIAQHLNTTKYTNFEPNEIYDILNRGFYTTEGIKNGVQELQRIIKNHVTDVITKLKRTFDTTNIDNIYLIGGGAIELESHLKELLPGAKVEENAQFTNAECFELMGKLKFNSK